MRAPLRLVLSSFAFATAVSIASVASAAPGEVKTVEDYPTCAGRTVSPKDSEAAHVKYLAGKVEYDDYHHAEAIRLFRDAYVRDCTKHELLVIISRSYSLLGDLPEAIRALETYLERVPASPEAGTYRKQIDVMKERLAKAPPAKPAEPPADKPASTPAERPAEPPPPAAAEDRHHTVFPWLLVGVGGAAVATGVVFLAIAPDLPAGCSEETNRCQPIGTPAEIEERNTTASHAKNYPQIGVGLLAGGAVLVGGGLLWHFLEPTSQPTSPKPKAASLVPVPALGPGYGGVALGGRF